MTATLTALAVLSGSLLVGIAVGKVLSCCRELAERNAQSIAEAGAVDAAEAGCITFSPAEERVLRSYGVLPPKG